MVRQNAAVSFPCLLKCNQVMIIKMMMIRNDHPTFFSFYFLLPSLDIFFKEVVIISRMWTFCTKKGTQI